MSVLVFAESREGQFLRASQEAVSFAKQTADLLGDKVVAVALNVSQEVAKELGQFGADHVVVVNQDELSKFDSGRIAKAVTTIAEEQTATTMVFSNTPNGRAVAPRVAVKMNAGIVSGVIEVPKNENGLVVTKSVFSGKGFAHVSFTTDKKVIAIQPNSIGITEFNSTPTIEEKTVDVSSIRAVKVVGENKDAEGIPLPEAERVVSGGRGLKGPENWGMIEELAHLLNAATACSRPVADAGWRPHYEHVGQTGLTIRPNLYIAIGISGAIQHLAGVNQSKVIVVINTDPEAPFFKAADYGIVGDAFEVVPKLIEAWKA